MLFVSLSLSFSLSLSRLTIARNYWAKDIILLITSNDTLGAQAWLDSYLGFETPGNGEICRNDINFCIPKVCVVISRAFVCVYTPFYVNISMYYIYMCIVVLLR